MPGFATSDAHARPGAAADGGGRLQRAARSTSGRAASRCCADIGHPYADGEPVYDITFENVQAGERTSHLFRLANLTRRARRRHRRPERAGARLVHLRRRRPHVALQRQRQRAEDADQAPDALGRARAARSSAATTPVLDAILATEISPELVPGDASDAAGAEHRGRASARTSCRTSTSTTSCASATRRPRWRSWPGHAWHDREPGRWPDAPDVPRNAYTLAEIKTHLRIFLLPLLQDQPVQALAACRTRPRSARAARSRRAATGARRAIRRRRSGSTSSSGARRMSPPASGATTGSRTTFRTPSPRRRRRRAICAAAAARARSSAAPASARAPSSCRRRACRSWWRATSRSTGACSTSST